MSNYAKIENNIVVDIVVADQEWIDAHPADWMEIPEGQYAWIGTALVDGHLVSPQPFPSWTLDSNYIWQPPTPMPTTGNWYWDEATLSWIEYPNT